jgi:hypothetical protein
MSREEAWAAVTRYMGEVSELNYLTMIVCRLFELQVPHSNHGYGVFASFPSY